jgi:hypothetical protein
VTQEQAVVGETSTLRLGFSRWPEPDTVIIDNNTHRLLGELFEYRARSET